MQLQHHMSLRVNGDGVLRRRDFLKGISAGALAAGATSWSDLVTVRADDLRARGMACILLYMQGGPSAFETFSPKPGHSNGGETKAISTNVAGIEVSDNLPQLAKRMDDLAIIRSMSTKEGAHPRAVYMMHTGRIPTASLRFPTMGSMVTHQLPQEKLELPAFVRVGGRAFDTGAGFLGSGFDPFHMPSAERPPSNAQFTTTEARYKRRLALLDRFERISADKELSKEHQKVYSQAARMITSVQMNAFDLEREPAKVRDAYGRTEFGSACLLARRLIESGVTFVEINHGNWDTHQDNFPRSKTLCGEIDQPFAELLRDLKARRMLDKTLIIWMGEFGRTPKINPRGGRDHHPRAFNMVLAGGGVRGGQVIGATDAGGENVTDRPVNEKDLFKTICQALKIDPDTELMTPVGRPVALVDGGQSVKELFA